MQPVKMIFPLEIHGLEIMGILENAMVIAIIVQTITAIAMVDGIMVTVISMAVSVVAMVAEEVLHYEIDGVLLWHYSMLLKNQLAKRLLYYTATTVTMSW
jgi:hypothetical protein